MKNAIAVNVNNLELFEIMVNNFPLEIEDDLICIFTDTRVKDIVKEIYEILDTCCLKLNYKVFTDKDVYKQLSKIFDISKFAEEYTMSLNILMYWFCFKFNKSINALLVVDDDIILGTGVNDLFDGEEKFFVDKLNRAQLNIIKDTEKCNKVFSSLISCFHSDISIEDIISTYINGGHKLHYRKNFNCGLYEEGLRQFFYSEYLYKVWLSRKSYRSSFLDERFENVYLTLTTKRNNILHEKKKCRFFNMSKISDGILRSCVNYPIVHICNGKYKMQTYKKLKELKVIK